MKSIDVNYTEVEKSDDAGVFLPPQANEFVADVSLELRTSLTSIRGALGLLRSGMLDSKSEQGKRMLQIAINNTDRLVRFTNALEATNRVLAEATTSQEAICQILEVLCKQMAWQIGEFWKIEQVEKLEPTTVLRCLEIWHDESVSIPEFEEATKKITFAPGIGLPGRIWVSGNPQWLPDVFEDSNFERRAIAEKSGLHTAFGFPVFSGRKILGIITFFNQQILPQDQSLLKMMTAIGSKIGQFLERKQAQEALEKSQAQLQKQTLQLQEALQNLKYAQSQLVQNEKMSALGQMVAGVAHEINNPINFIHGNLDYTNQYAQELLDLIQIYANNYPKAVPEVQNKVSEIDLDFIKEDLPKILASMKFGSERIREIVLSLRNFSRLHEAEKKLVNLHEGIESTLLIMGNKLNFCSKKIDIKIVKKYGNLPLVECYAGQLNQVFMNILNNAAEAIEEVIDKRLLEDSGFSPQILIRTEFSESGDIVIRIADNGIGMTENVKKQILDPFFTTKPVGKGSGLGLSVSYQIVVEKHGGILQCTSEPGKGTEFLIQLPIQN
ncbi:MAG: histidine kinase dimerization/phospho-acceptor domain-containing protein [Potamolinea sp.]